MLLLFDLPLVEPLAELGQLPRLWLELHGYRVAGGNADALAAQQHGFIQLAPVLIRHAQLQLAQLVQARLDMLLAQRAIQTGGRLRFTGIGGQQHLDGAAGLREGEDETLGTRPWAQQIEPLRAVVHPAVRGRRQQAWPELARQWRLRLGQLLFQYLETGDQIPARRLLLAELLLQALQLAPHLAQGLLAPLGMGDALLRRADQGPAIQPDDIGLAFIARSLGRSSLGSRTTLQPGLGRRFDHAPRTGLLNLHPGSLDRFRACS